MSKIKTAKDSSSPLKCFAFRLKPHEDLKEGIIAFAKKNRIHAGFILTCVGSVEQIHLRFANRINGTLKSGYFEMVGLTGTFSGSSAHLHLIVADKMGKTMAGHLLKGTAVYTTAEIVVGSLPALQFGRKMDADSGYAELTVSKTKTRRKK